MSEFHGPKFQEMHYPAFQFSNILRGSMPPDLPRDDGLKPFIWVLWTHNRLLFTKLWLENPVNKKLSFLNCFLCRGAEDVELWFTEVENLLALEDVGKVNYW